MSKETDKPTFIITWKLMALGVLVFIVIRALLWIVEAKFHIGLGQLGQAIVAGMVGTLVLFVLGRNKNGNV